MVRLSQSSDALYEALTVLRQAGNIVDRSGLRMAVITGPHGPRKVSTIRLIRIAGALKANDNMHVSREAEPIP